MSVQGRHADVSEPHEVVGTPRRRAEIAQLERVAAVGLVFVIALRYRLSPDIPIGYLVAGAMLPITVRMLTRHRGILAIVVLSLAAAVSGLMLSWRYVAEGSVDHSVLIVQSVRVVGLALATLGLLWARSILGTRWVVLVFSLGTFASLAVNGINHLNVWKFSLSVPVILLVLSLPQVYRRRPAEFAALCALTVVSATHTSRSSAAMLLIAAGLVASQGQLFTGMRSRTSSAFTSFARLAVFGLGVYYLVRAAALEGVLGEATRTRTVDQIENSGSLLLGGRPEIGASIALIRDQVSGYGVGVVPTSTQIEAAREGMEKLGQRPDIGYVQHYMFGVNGIELHSMLGDLWVTFGVIGTVLGVVVVVCSVSGVVWALSRSAASAVALFLTVRLVWDFAFSPFASAMLTLPLALAIVLPVLTRDRTAVEPPDGAESVEDLYARIRGRHRG